jgi:pentose-5-phosphate-3-epimerase
LSDRYGNIRKAPININPHEISLSASLMCADVLNLGEQLKLLEDAHIEYIHCDIMDGHFVPNLMLVLNWLTKPMIIPRSHMIFTL